MKYFILGFFGTLTMLISTDEILKRRKTTERSENQQ